MVYGGPGCAPQVPVVPRPRMHLWMPREGLRQGLDRHATVERKCLMAKDDRLFIRTSLDMPSNPKIVSAPAATKWLDICGQIVAKRELSDGIIRPAVAIAEADVPAKHGRDLIRRGRWHEPGHECDRCAQPPRGHVVIHDFLAHQQSREEVEAARRAKSQAGKKGAAARWDGKGDGTCHGSSHGKGDGRADGKPIAESESDADNLVWFPGQSSSLPLDEDGLTKIQEATRGPRDHAIKVARHVLSRANGDVKNPVRYVLAAIADEPENHRYRRGNPTKATACPQHPGEWADACRIHLVEGRA